MTIAAVTTPFPQFFGTDGKPLANGKLYFGAVNLNPETNPVTVYWDEAGTQPAAQPIRTKNGYPVRNGAITSLFADGAFSLATKTSANALVSYAPDSTAIQPLVSISGDNGSNLIGFIQSGVGAVKRTAQDKLRETKSVGDFGAIGAGNDASVIQLALDSMTGGGDLYATDLAYDIGSTQINMSHAGTKLILGNSTVINYTGNTAIKMIGAGCSIVGGKHGGFIGPSAWDGANTAPTYGVIWITGGNCSLFGVRLSNIKKVGVWAKDVEDCSISECLIEGNYPSGSWTGVETGHWGVIFDPGAGASGGNFKLADNSIKSCVQGCQPGNYGVGGVVRGFVATGNLFEGCWNHGIYSNFTNGATITGNNFNRCQIPVVTSGNNNVISGNTMYTAQSASGDERDVIGISVRDGSFNSITGNTLRGVLTPPSNGVAINIQDVSGVSDLIGNVISGNTIEIPSGAGVAIRISASTKICSSNVISGNTVRAPGSPAEGLIGVYGSSQKVGGAVLSVTNASPGVIAMTTAHGLAVNDPVTLIDFQGMTQINGRYLVNSTPTSTTFTVKSFAGSPIDTSAFGAWTSNGEVRRSNLINAANKITGNNLVSLGKSAGIYLISQYGATVSGNTVEWQYSAGSAENVSCVALFDSYKCAVTNNASAIRSYFGANVTVQGYREFSGTITQQVFANYTADNLDQVDGSAGAAYQAIEALSGSGLLINQFGAYAPTIQCAVGSIFRNTAGGVNSTLYIKQAGTAGLGWVPMGVGLIDVSAADLANKSASINTSEKYTGKLVWDTTNGRAMRALGATDVGGWRVIDGSLTITPV